MPAPVHIRPPRLLRAYIAVFGVAWTGGVLLGAVQALPRADALILLVMAAFGAVMSWRLFQAGVNADARGLEVRNWYRTKRYRWDQVEGFRLGSFMGGVGFGQVIHVLLADDTVATLDVTMNPVVFGGRAKRERWLRDLRAWVPANEGPGPGQA